MLKTLAEIWASMVLMVIVTILIVSYLGASYTITRSIIECCYDMTTKKNKLAQAMLRTLLFIAAAIIGLFWPLVILWGYLFD